MKLLADLQVDLCRRSVRLNGEEQISGVSKPDVSKIEITIDGNGWKVTVTELISHTNDYKVEDYFISRDEQRDTFLLPLDELIRKKRGY